MHRVVTILLVLSFFVAALTARVQAVALADLPAGEQSPSNETFFGSSFNWDYVYNYKGSSASAVDHYWILTAAHVADDGGTGSLIIDGETYMQQEVVFHSQATDPDGHLTADIALVRYDKPFPGYYLLTDTVPVGSEIMICGFGRPGNVVSTFSTAIFTEDETGHSTKRWGTNTIDQERTYSSTDPIVAASKGFDITISKDRRNAGKTVYEAGCNIYDSGGGMFYNDGGTWKLTGHMIARSSISTNQHTGNFAVAAKYYENWIKSVIIDYDTSMNGLPDWWEAEHSVSDAEDDPDRDGFTNYDEWIADTDPNLGSSYLAVAAYTLSSELVFESSEDRKYRIEYSDALLNPNWATEIDWFEGSVSQSIQAVSNAESNRFYRIRAKRR